MLVVVPIVPVAVLATVAMRDLTGHADEEPVPPDVVEAADGLAVRFEAVQDGLGAVPGYLLGGGFVHRVPTCFVDEVGEHGFVVEEAVGEVAGHVCLVALGVEHLERDRWVVEHAHAVGADRPEAESGGDPGEHRPSFHILGSVMDERMGFDGTGTLSALAHPALGMSDDDISIDEKRVYGDQSGAVDLAIATRMGVARVSVSGEQVGEFGLATRESARDVVTAPPGTGQADDTGTGVAVATDEDVLIGDPDDLRPTGFGPAVAVGRRDGTLLAADDTGRIAQWTGDSAATTTAGGDGDAWTDIATLDAVVRALDGDLVATRAGVYRFTKDAFQPSGLDDAWDVAGGLVPHAATSQGLYRLGNGWMDALDGDFRVVQITADGGRVGRGHAATEDGFYEHRDGEWTECDVPGRVTDVAHGPRDYAITEDGTFLLRRDDGWHSRTLGLPDAVGIAVVGSGDSSWG